MSAATIALHEQLLRLAKGVIAAWEHWLAAQKEEVSKAA